MPLEADKNKVRFWNGNKSSARQEYELIVLEKALAAADEQQDSWEIETDCTDFPTIEGEASVFRKKRFDVFATVAGNPKFTNEDKRVLPIDLMNGLLGRRLLVIRSEDADDFSRITTEDQMRKRVAGIPFSWADAQLFRANNYAVNEGGSYDEIFLRLKDKQFDYVSLGANEIEDAFETRCVPLGGLQIAPKLSIQYPYPLLFYVNPRSEQIALAFKRGLELLIRDKALDRLFQAHYGKLIERLKLGQRKTFHLSNPLLPA
ncbi:hypothetical protein [Pelagicoccus mobilis]|uniref:Uncharacterized protein n=1 Tax=Pelagicoccus mobilis TaxID=415221 RepID=A0A934RWD1_9BACT|nr:hypothetical protein [Pelagicoccus mobilis]MBK1877573.1 hypothetical protein [Pelagicoccus mobilis]